MILLCSGQVSLRHLDALLLFATGLRDAGHSVAIDDRFVPEGLSRHQKFEAVPFLVTAEKSEPDLLVIVAAEDVSEQVQTLLRTAPRHGGMRVAAVGSFETPQQQINSANRIAYATGTEPEIVNRWSAQIRPLIEAPVVPLVTSISDQPQQSDGERTRLLVYLPHELLEEDGVLTDVAALEHTPGTDLHVLTTAKGKELIRSSQHARLSVFGYSELSPSNLLTYADVFAFFGPGIPGERMAFLALIAMGSGKVVIDCTTTSAFKSAGAPALRGPEGLRALAGYMADVIAPTRREIGRRILQDAWLQSTDIRRLTDSLNLTPGQPQSSGRNGGDLVFFPTNGVGLGHAQRCALIADECRSGPAVRFAAFPSCTDMLRRRGYDCMPMVARSTLHENQYAADLVNYLRLRGTTGSQDTLVFDGGYVFDSVYRVISENKLRAWWIRRGLWQPGHVNASVLERERAFHGVIIPEEAFAELNETYSTGPHVHRVGPVVRREKPTAKDIKTLRKRLADHFDHPFKTLAVTMLGSGAASERTSQIQMLCSEAEQRPDTLHLILAWPHSAASGAFDGWQNSRVVRTDHALGLCHAADLVVSAAGYNSFHELIYAGIPAILVPNHASWLDDQEKRCRAADQRQLAAFVPADDLLGLGRTVQDFLGGARAAEIRAALREADLPTTGNKAAADLIAKGSGL